MKSLFERTGMENCFYLLGGKQLFNVAELLGELPVMDDEVYNHHVRQGNNDFSNWIRNIYEHKMLAGKVAKAKNRKEITLIIEEALKKEEQKKPTAGKKK